MGEPPRREGITRRGALVIIGGTAAGLAAGSRAARALPAGKGPALISPNLSLPVVRPLDMLNLRFDFYGVNTVVTNGQTSVVPKANSTALLVVTFPAQHVGELAVPAPTQSPFDVLYPNTPLPGVFSGPTWLAFTLPADASIPLTASGLLDWASLAPQLPAADPAAPALGATALEVPWSLWLAPVPVEFLKSHRNPSWFHASAPVTSGGRTELWHTRLGLGALVPPGRVQVPPAEPPTVTPQLQASWSYGYVPPPNQNFPPDPITLMSLTAQNRADIVTNTTGPQGIAVDVRFLALSALGAFLDVTGNWSNLPAGDSLIQWKHRASAGRDGYVKVVDRGFLFPFGHRAVCIKISRREFQVSADGETVGYLVQRLYIEVTEPVKSYPSEPFEPYAGRANPMRAVEVKTLSTQVDDTTDSLFWVQLGGQDVPFSFAATDAEMRVTDFSLPVFWLDESVLASGAQATIEFLIEAYASFATRNSASLGGALLAFADNGNVPGSTAHHVDTYTFSAVYNASYVNGSASGGAPFYPILHNQVLLPNKGTSAVVPAVPGAQIHMPAAEQLTGKALQQLPVVTTYVNYVNDNFTGAAAGAPEIYLQVAGGPGPGLSFPPNVSGGAVTPDFTVSGLARDLGPVAGDPMAEDPLGTLWGGTFNPQQYFGKLASGGFGTLLGAIDVFKIVKGSDSGAMASTQAPRITSTQSSTALDTTLAWSPQLHPDSDGVFTPSTADGKATLVVTAQIHTPIADPSQATYKIHGALDNFQVTLFGAASSYVTVEFSSLTFDARTGAKPSVSPRIKSVSFDGPLKFIQDLAQLLGSLGGPSITVTPEMVTASYTLAVPSESVGVFALSNLTISGGLTIPFDGSPVRVRFGLSSQEHPFVLTVWLFGGGGFLSLAVGADGIEEIQVSLEFGAAISVDLGVASGGVSIMAGIYFSQQSNPSQVVLTGFVRADGNLSVLGIITLSLEFYLGLTYQDPPGEAYGEATMTVSISFLFFSASVPVTMKKSFGGGNDPDFGMAVTSGDWTTYCEAFA
jgi:hypothetical protein